MSDPLHTSPDSRCVIIGASHGGIGVAFAMRQFGWKGHISVYDALESFPHQKPPLSKDFLLGKSPEAMLRLRAEKLFEKARVDLNLGQRVEGIDASSKTLTVSGEQIAYDKLIIATGADAFDPPFPGVDNATNLFTMRHLPDAEKLKACVDGFIAADTKPKAVIIGAGYIGLEAAASLTKLGASVTVLERESRVLQRVTAPEMSKFFTEAHEAHGVNILTATSVSSIEQEGETQYVCCDNGERFEADLILVGVGVRVNQKLAEQAGLEAGNGIAVNGQCQTSDPDIYAIGDCSEHYSPLYDRRLRLESVQNATDQANVAAMHLCGREAEYNAVPWFWSDQYDLKLQIAGLLTGYTDVVVRQDESNPKSISVWYFDNERLLSVDAVNQPKSYNTGLKLITAKTKVDKQALADAEEPITPDAITAVPA
ncbi:MAG: FAD/NAD(P)-binding oxidoreductase [Planctomycetota bacterium]